MQRSYNHDPTKRSRKASLNQTKQKGSNTSLKRNLLRTATKGQGLQLATSAITLPTTTAKLLGKSQYQHRIGVLVLVGIGIGYSYS